MKLFLKRQIPSKGLLKKAWGKKPIKRRAPASRQRRLLTSALRYKQNFKLPFKTYLGNRKIMRKMRVQASRARKTGNKNSKRNKTLLKLSS